MRIQFKGYFDRARLAGSVGAEKGHGLEGTRDGR